MTVLVMRLRKLAAGSVVTLTALLSLLIIGALMIPLLETSSGWQVTRILFLGIVLEALPFLLLGVIISSLIEVFISAERLRQWLPSRPWASILVASVVGVVFPFCECGIIPVARRLIQKGVPLSAGIAFLLTAPIVNPVVIASTAMAFRGNETLIFGRVVGALAVAWLTAALLLYWRGNGLKVNGVSAGCGCGHDHDHYHHHGFSHRPSATGFPGPRMQKLKQAGIHAVDEFFDMGRYFLFGALLASVLQVVVTREWLISVGAESGASTVAMMLMAFALSVCSNADAFLAGAFASDFTPGSIVAFLVLGPMLDIKNTFMLFRTFKTGLVIFLLAWLPLLVYGLAWWVNRNA